MGADVLLGLQWGDEGKGKIVDVLTPDYDIIARFQGGPNAGHTLEFEGIKHVLHTIPSGIFRNNVVNIIGNGVVIDPIILKKEIEELEKLNVDVVQKLFISKKAHLILPTHKLLDRASEKAKGKRKIGSTLKGIGPTYMDKTGRNGLRIGDISSQNFKTRFERLREKHFQLLDEIDNDYNNLEVDFLSSIEFLKRFQHIFKAYCTRVGSGPFPTELSDDVGTKMRDIGHEYGATTGRERRCGWLDLPALKYSIMINGVTELCMMKADVLDSFDEIQVCTHYQIGEEKFNYFPFEISENTKPVYRNFQGWNTDITKLKDKDNLPLALLNYIQFLEEELEVPIKIISVGPNRSETIVR